MLTLPYCLCVVCSALQGEYLSLIRDCYDDRRFPPLVRAAEAPPVAASAASTSTEDDDAQGSNTSAAAAAGTNFQQKIELAPLAQLTALGDIAQQQAASNSSGDGTLDGESAALVDGGGDVRLRSAVESHTSSSSRQSVIVIASLVSKLPNLAGLARTCEIFQSARLMVSDRERVVNDGEFQAIAVTAHRWMPIEQLQAADIAAFIRARKEEGYTTVALEQSAASISLPRFQFPRRLVILLGAEKEGVPIELLNLVDRCVEIPQLGIIRSLNVHVSASILLWEYTRQNMLGLIADS